MSRKKSPQIGKLLGIGKRIREIRGNITQIDFGKMFGVGGNTVSRWEKGRLSDEETLKKIAIYGGVSLDYLLRGKENTAPALKVAETPPPAYSTSRSDFDTDLLTAVLTLIEEVIAAEPVNLIAAQKTRLILRLYDDCRTQNIQPTRHQVRKLLYLDD